MPYRVLADLVVLTHLAFILFAVFGGILVLLWKRCAWVHLPAVLWAALIEFMGWVCPLTPLENWLRQRGGGGAPYTAGFVEHYLLPILYPASLSRELQWGLAGLVLVVNAGVYLFVLRRRMRSSHSSRPA